MYFLGREDRQVKIRGYRVELGEIERAILAASGKELGGVVCVPFEATPGAGAVVVAYIVMKNATKAEEDALVAQVRAAVRTQLPTYMVPAYFTFLDRFPLNRNDKIDLAALPKPDPTQQHAVAAATVPLSNDLERRLVSVFAGVLNVKEESIGAGACPAH